MMSEMKSMADENRRLKKMFAELSVQNHGVSVALACRTFGVSETCYRYERKLDDENAVIADWLVRLTDNRRNWGFGLCFLYLRNVAQYAPSRVKVATQKHLYCQPCSCKHHILNPAD
jgi:putative transposase